MQMCEQLRFVQSMTWRALNSSAVLWRVKVAKQDCFLTGSMLRKADGMISEGKWTQPRVQRSTQKDACLDINVPTDNTARVSGGFYPLSPKSDTECRLIEVMILLIGGRSASLLFLQEPHHPATFTAYWHLCTCLLCLPSFKLCLVRTSYGPEKLKIMSGPSLWCSRQSFARAAVSWALKNWEIVVSKYRQQDICG